LWSEFSGPTLNGSIISGNNADAGGGLYLIDSPITLINSIVAANQATSAGSGLYIAGAHGGATHHLLHNTITRNGGDNGSGIYVAESSWDPVTVALTNTILVSHTLGITVATGNTAMLEATLWGTDTWANTTDWAGEGTIITGTINIWGEPAFVEPNAGDYHIGPNSIAIDTGMNAGVITDIDGEPRPMYMGYDIGADEVFLGPRLEIAKRATPISVQSGEQLTYTLFVTNIGTVSLTATITDILPDHVTPTGPLTWTPPALLPDDTWTEMVIATIDIGYVGPLTNIVQITTSEGVMGVYTHTTMAKTVVYLPLILRAFP
jgi:uncharacterized repeat protein (TIGR01451 family)